jgi:hypothetical protein
MLQVRGVTYRVDRTAPHRYSVVRLLDDAEVGTFCTLPALRIHPLRVEDNVMRDVVRAALRSARTSAVMHVAPISHPPEEPEPSRPAEERESLPSPALERDSSPSAVASPRPSSSLPPRESAMA